MIVSFVIIVLVIVPAVVAFLTSSSPRTLIRPVFGIGAPIVYSRRAISNQPVFGARDIRPAERGEFYYYNLVSYLRVTHVLEDGSVIAIARDNRRLRFTPKDADFRKAGPVERLIYRWRFPHL